MQSNCIYAMEIKNKKQTSGKGREGHIRNVNWGMEMAKEHNIL